MNDIIIDQNNDNDLLLLMNCKLFNNENQINDLCGNPISINNTFDNKNNIDSVILSDKKNDLGNESDFDSENSNNFFLIKNEMSIFNIEKLKQDLLSTGQKSKENNLKDLGLKPVKCKKEKIFKITKDFKGKGRIKKNTIFVGKHNKFSEDNIIRKIKGRFLEKCRIYINDLYINHFLNKKTNKKDIPILLQRIDSKIARQIKKETIIEWLESKLYKVFSENVSMKCSLYKKDYNKRQIKLLYQKNEVIEVIQILNMSVREMFEIFTKDIKRGEFKTLKYDLEEMKQKMKDEEDIDEYLYQYEYIAKNLELIFKKKNPRNNKKIKP